MASPPPAGPVVTLVDPGAPPRAPLVYPEAGRPGARVERVLRASMRQDTSLDGAPTLSIGSPPFAIPITMSPPAAAGEPWRYELGRIATERGELADSPVFAQLFSSWEPASGTLHVDARGVRQPGSHTIMGGHSSDLANEPLKLVDEIFDAWIPVVPAEPVGVGATWKVTDVIARGGIELERTATFTLVGRARGAARVRAEVALVSREAQRITVVYQHEQHRVAVAYWKVKIVGETTLDPASILPRRAGATYHVEFLVLDERRAGGENRTNHQPNVVELRAELE